MHATLATHRLVVVTGKGGVGKSVVAATLAHVFAAAGRRVVLLESDVRESLHAFLGCEPSGGAFVEAAAGLHLQNVDPVAAIEERVREQVRVAALAHRITSSEAFRTFVAGAPGLGEVALLAHALRLVRGKAKRAPRADVVVLDAPATGHGLSLLEAPALVAEAGGHGPFGELAREAAALVADAQATAVVAVTTAEEMPVDETLDLVRALRVAVGCGPALFVANALRTPLAAGVPEVAAVTLWRRRRALEQRELGRLRRLVAPAPVELPLVPGASGPELVAVLAPPLAAALRGGAR